MAENESEMAGFSLADLAGIDVSDIEEVRFSSLEPGAYGFEINEADLGEDEKDGNRRFFARFDMKVVEVKTILTPGIDKESQIGKAHAERFFIDPFQAGGRGQEVDRSNPCVPYGHRTQLGRSTRRRRAQCEESRLRRQDRSANGQGRQEHQVCSTQA
jgi:hypothetical protein